MELRDRVAIVTGGANGIGRALAKAFARAGARGVVIGDLDGAGAERTASEISAAGGAALGLACNVAIEAEVQGLVARAEARFGPVDLFFANAGVARGGPPDAPDADWDLSWRVNVLHHVYAARACLPAWLERGEGYFCSTASAAGLLTQIGSATYAVTKHAAVAFAEWMSVTYGDQGIKVSCLCPQGVRTDMLMSGIEGSGAKAVLAGGDVLEPDQVGEIVVQGIRDEKFLILPHPEVLTYLQRKTTDYDRWLGGMRRLQARINSPQ
jgi:NAD(P)-dependent dehydrogenase (short-subunit alcohol dehydrogenase family)